MSISHSHSLQQCPTTPRPRSILLSSRGTNCADRACPVDDFTARSSDELSLSKGDTVELIERDDEFGDGWFLGRHLGSKNTGLFPEGLSPGPYDLSSQLILAVYTRVAPKAPPPAAPPVAAFPTPLAPLAEAVPEKPTVVVNDHSEPDKPAQPAHTPLDQDTPITLPLNSSKTESAPPPTKSNDGPVATAPGRPPGTNVPNQDSQVLNDTLNVINEHITDLRSPASNGALRTPGADSGSEYSASLHHRMSYIQGEETDEEEEATHTRPDVEAWSPDDVAEFLFTSGVEKQHCEVFRDQEISGEVLLAMDQSSLFIKALDLGSVGRRLKTWHKIKSLQDEVSGKGTATRRTTQTYGSDVGSEDVPRGRVRTSTINSVSNPHISVQTRRLSSTNTPPSHTPISQDSPTQSGHLKRPSAASVRDLHHSRRHSSTDYHLAGSTTPRLAANGTFPGADNAHKKQPSFDRNWTLGGAASRPLSQTGTRVVGGNSDPELQDSAVDLDRGYFSGTEVDGRTRNTLRKRDSVAHSRKSSYAEEQRVRSATALSRHSRFGSIDSYRNSSQLTAAQKYYGAQSVPHRRTASTHTTESIRPMPPAKDNPAPTVTRLDSSRGSDRSKPPPPPSKDGDWLSSLVHKPIAKTGVGIRAISDNLGFDRSKHSASGDSKDQPLPSPARTGSSTPSGGASFDMESPDATKSPTGNTPASRNKGRKGKKETSAYTRGLLRISPQEAMQGAEYSGWMRKKSSNLMTTWKPRFFVLKGRRMAYYYSEDDDSEKGLIDISFHRVLPADNEKLTGIHASITGAAGGQGMNLLPSGGNSESLDKGDDAMFIFKLVPPRAGLSRGVHFTKPTVHYFAVPNLKQGRLWMAALMKATIDRDDTQPITTTYQQKTISLAKAKQMRHRPPALMNLEETAEDEQATASQQKDSNGLGIFSEADSGVAGVEKGGGQSPDGAGTAPPLESA